jgi:hypothetical protein
LAFAGDFHEVHMSSMAEFRLAGIRRPSRVKKIEPGASEPGDG